MFKYVDLAASIKGDFYSWLQGLLNWILENPSLLFITAGFAFIPVVFWFWMYYRKVTMDKAHRRLMIRTFFFGMFSVLPVLVFDYLMAKYFDFDLNYFINESTLNKSFGLLFLGYIIVGVLEEYSKAVVVKEVDFRQKSFNRIVDGIEFAVAAALGFAFIENIIYFVQAVDVFSLKSADFVQIVIVRSIFSMLAHTLFSGIFGYYYGKAKFVGVPTPEEKKRLLALHIHKGAKVRYHRLKHLIFNRKNIHLHEEFAGILKEEELIAEGLMIAILFHALFDFFLGINLTFMIVPLLMIEYGIFLHEFQVHRNLETFET